jgi:hypothetical protein
MNIVGSLRETIKTMQGFESYGAYVIQENMYVNFISDCGKMKTLHNKENFWKMKTKEDRRDIVQGFVVYKQGNPEMPKEDEELIKRIMLLTKDPLPELQNKQPA